MKMRRSTEGVNKIPVTLKEETVLGTLLITSVVFNKQSW